jgi:hypothetical protein
VYQEIVGSANMQHLSEMLAGCLGRLSQLAHHCRVNRDTRLDRPVAIRMLPDIRSIAS